MLSFHPLRCRHAKICTYIDIYIRSFTETSTHEIHTTSKQLWDTHSHSHIHTPSQPVHVILILILIHIVIVVVGNCIGVISATLATPSTLSKYVNVYALCSYVCTWECTYVHK